MRSLPYGADADTDAHAYTDSYADADADAYAYADPNARTDTDSGTYADADAHAPPPYASPHRR